MSEIGKAGSETHGLHGLSTFCKAGKVSLGPAKIVWSQACRCKAEQGWRGMAKSSMAWQAQSWQCGVRLARSVPDQHTPARLGAARLSNARLARLGVARRTRRGMSKALQGRLGTVGSGRERHVPVLHGLAGSAWSVGSKFCTAKPSKVLLSRAGTAEK